MSNFTSQDQATSEVELERVSQEKTVPMHILHAPIKVPEVTIFFWMIKLLTTALGESTSDYLVNNMSPVHAVALGGIGLVAMLVLQFVVSRYIPWIYWLTAILVAVFGTMAADVIHVALGVPYVVSTFGFLIALGSIFGIWYMSEKTLSIHSIYTRKRELFYWAAIITTFALGTAVGDLTANTLGWGYLVSGILFTLFFALPGLAYWLLRLNGIAAFWIAYILTRPLGASFADWMGKAHESGGLGWGDDLVSLVLAALIAALLIYLTITRKDMPKGERDLPGKKAI